MQTTSTREVKRLTDFEQAYREHFALVKGFLLSLSHNESLAEELTQETFYQAMRHWKEFRQDCSVTTWLCTIAKRLYLNVMRRHAPVPLDAVGEQTDSRDLEDDLIRSDRQMAAHRLLHDLPEPYREVFTLRTFGDLDHRQIGSLFGKSDSWARVTYYRARQMLQAKAKEKWKHEE